MGIDACVLLRVRDADAFGAALAAKREFAATPHRLDDCSVSLSSGLRFDDADAPLVLRHWLHTLLGPALVHIIDCDPRGFFIYPDVAEPRATRYEAIVAELGDCGRFIDGAAPSERELAAHEEKRSAEFAAIEVAVARGDFSAFAPPPVCIEAGPAARDEGGEPEIDLGALLRRLEDADGPSS